MNTWTKTAGVAGASLAIAAACLFIADGALVAADRSGDVDAQALERTRKQVRMLDDLYKTAVVLITTHYVNDDADLPAGTAAIALFDAMKNKGWHEARLLDATGLPTNDKNAPSDEFEKTAIAKLKAGAAYHEAVVERDGKPYLRAATIVPVVMEKCTMCHDHYKAAKPGEAIGALSYTLPIE
ncbi:MAG: DUF3365 domain-containing protein [Pirellulales bacterium]|nr:DUF3365 domain-containing protein [Pirellulales bacterium]